MSTLHLLEDKEIINIYEQAIKQNLDSDFLEIILIELKRRNIHIQN